MDSFPVSHLRRRTSSFVHSENEPPFSEEFDHVPSLGSTESLPAKSTRFRRSSFALSGERQTTLDRLVDSASLQMLNVAANREAAAISALVTPPSESAQCKIPYTDECSYSDCQTDQQAKRVSAATLVSDPSQVQDVSRLSPGSTSPSNGSSNLEQCDQPRSFVWHNTDAFSTNPLMSDLVVKYLAGLAADNRSRQASPSRTSSSKISAGVGENIPGFLSVDTSAVASMTMPVYRVRRAHDTHTLLCPTKSSFSHDPKYPIHSYMNDKDFARGLSDSDSFSGVRHNRGYLSDNPAVFDSNFETKQFRSIGQRLDPDFHVTTLSLPRSPKKLRPRSRVSAKSADHSFLFESVSSSTSLDSSKFDVTHVYDGLPSHVTTGPNLSTSTTSLNSYFPPPCHTPPSTPNSLSSRSSANQSLTSSHGIHRLRSLLDHLKPQLADDGGEQYIYLDEETRARRANAQASNVISPVSF